MVPPEIIQDQFIKSLLNEDVFVQRINKQLLFLDKQTYKTRSKFKTQNL